MESTKNRILYESLRLFAHKGYDGVSMREIAAAVGIKGASLYNHYKGKEEIFRAIFEEMKSIYDESANMMKIPSMAGKEATEMFNGINEEVLLEMVNQLLELFTQNEFMVLFRRMVTSEQHKFDIAAKVYNSYYLEAPVHFQEKLFEGLKETGRFSGYDAGMLALHFYSPIYYILCRFDMGLPYEECKMLAIEHVIDFVKVYD